MSWQGTLWILPETVPGTRGSGLLTGRRAHYCLLCAILVLSAYVHLWNPVGFPDIFFDEGIYMRRAVNVIETGSPQERYFYDHPYFGQIVLAGFLKLAGFPESVRESLEISYLVPRVLMGLFAVLDTFLIYKIAENRFGRRAAVLAAVLFAAMPMTWMFRRILLDTILMPFLLSSILLALYSGGRRHPGLLAAASAVLLGLAIFTKITAVVMIPLVAYIIASNRGIGRLAAWFLPVIAVPAAWPAVAAYFGHLDLWFKDVFWQAGRGTGQFWQITGLMFAIDPVMMGLGFAGLAFAILRRNVFLMLGLAPFLLFVNMVGFFQYFHYMLIMPVMCMAAAYAILAGMAVIKRPGVRRYAYVGAVAGLAAYGGIVSTSIVSVDLTGPQFSAMQYAIETFDEDEFTMLAGPVYTWVISAYGHGNVPLDYSDVLFEADWRRQDPKSPGNATMDHVNVSFEEPGPGHEYLIVDPHFILDLQRGERLSESIQGSRVIVEFSGEIPDANVFPYYSYMTTTEGSHIEIRTDREVP